MLRKICAVVLVAVVLNVVSFQAYAEVEYNGETYDDKTFLKMVNLTLEDWLEKDEWDFLGKKQGALMGILRVMYIGEEYYNDDGLVKTLTGIRRGAQFDKATAKNQIKLTSKQLEDNKLIYGALVAGVGGGIWGVKTYMSMSIEKKAGLMKSLMSGNPNKTFKMLVKYGSKIKK
ncbi:hypothetical protein [Natronincola ferrireducens]|uniref:Secreted protein n=1 Tax=Natronincola ferrireducens TaxID=393762 RepID=A0A1G9I7W9_9FIRM|nr:hypothetical protein [Natronincola ferrireducens]SDL21357.1 hypothetical protein SAMN05660472_02824 [Natronincola ferrireducens]